VGGRKKEEHSKGGGGRKKILYRYAWDNGTVERRRGHEGGEGFTSEEENFARKPAIWPWAIRGGTTQREDADLLRFWLGGNSLAGFQGKELIKDELRTRGRGGDARG